MEKLVTHINWFLATIPVGFIGLVTAPVLAPLAWVLERVFPNNNPLWWWLDDEIEHSSTNADWIIFKANSGIMGWYIWHGFRNTFWNFKNLIKPENAREHCVSNTEEIVEVLVDKLVRDGKNVDTTNNCIEMASIKWIDKNGNEGWQVNKGVKISTKYSTMGESKLWYRANGKLYYRYSIAKISKQLGFKSTFPFIGYSDHYLEFKMGTSEKRHLLTFKRGVIKD
tara:strand:- start:864 stop:1538 length:675 start_codon:yes stop_codon:yes gene_type:complete